jgi:peptidyl-prolyl cis-trans isomerase SurA
MKRIVATSVIALVAAVASRLGAQTPAPATATSSPVVLNGIVAVVGDQPITRIDLRERWLERIQRKELPEPANDSVAEAQQRDVLNDMIDEELLLQKAKDLKIEVADADITPMIDRQIAQVRSQFGTEAEYRSALVKGGLGSPEEYRRFLIDSYRRQATLDKTIAKLKQEGKIVPINVTDAEIAAEFERSKPFLGPKPASVTFKQIVIAPKPSAAAKEAARVKAESLLAQLKAGADFEKLAKRESMDLQSRDAGGDLGWERRGDNVPEFDRWLFGSQFIAPLAPGQMSPVFETALGFHIVRVDRAQPGEVRAHQILIMPKIDSADVVRTAKLADSVAGLLRKGVPFDSLAKKYHDYAGKEETSILTPFWRDSLPVSYQRAFSNVKAGTVVAFPIPGSAKRPDVPKYVVAQLLTVDEGGERTLGEVRAAIRSDLAQRGGVRRYVDTLRRQTYVSIRLNAMDVAAAKKP